MIQIRTNHPAGFHSGEWAILLARGSFEGNPVYVVKFPGWGDKMGDIDLWRIDDPAGQYEVREVA